MKPFTLPNDFYLGTATAATQIEGGDKNNNWYEWSTKNTIKGGGTTLRADDHWNRYREDISLMKCLNQKVYRMGIEWSRIEPENGRFDDEAMAHYRDEISLLLKNGIKPLLTLHHFTHPLWICKEGEFETERIVKYFERYVRYVVKNIGDLVSDYITINEPNVYVTNGYIFGIWPPAKKNFKLAMKVYINMTLCHIAAYKAIHELREGFAEKTMVGVANHLRIFRPYNNFSPFDRITAAIVSGLFQNEIVSLMSKGTSGPVLRFFSPKGIQGNYCDFIGINYYTRSTFRLRGFKDIVRPGLPKNDIGWEIYPQGLADLCESFYKKFKLPIWITENGVCDNDDDIRSEYIFNHLEQVALLCKKGIPVERYYHWSLLDNFEWLDGETARFGLIYVDYDTQKRTIKRSGEFYAEICKEHGVTQDMIDRYFGGQQIDERVKEVAGSK